MRETIHIHRLVNDRARPVHILANSVDQDSHSDILQQILPVKKASPIIDLLL